MRGEVVLRRVLILEDGGGALREVVALEVSGPGWSGTFWRLGVDEKDVRAARSLPGDET